MTEGEFKIRPSVCTVCKTSYSGWVVFCEECREWNKVVVAKGKEENRVEDNRNDPVGYAGAKPSVCMLSDIQLEKSSRIGTGNAAVDRVFGGGVVPGSVSLIAGPPGCGKSTLALQILCDIGESKKALLVASEENDKQIAARADRLEIGNAKLEVAVEHDISSIVSLLKSRSPDFVVVDSLAAIVSRSKAGRRGGAKQMEYCLTEINKFAKQSGSAFLVVCQSTKSGDYAGSREIEHMSDALFMMAISKESGSIQLRGQKNRHGSISEVGFLEFDPNNGRVVESE